MRHDFVLQAHHLYQVFKGFGTRGRRSYDFAIVDEVDSMLIDEKTKKVMLTRSAPGMELLLPILVDIWNDLASAKDEDPLKLEERLCERVGNRRYHLPMFLETYADSQRRKWVQSAITAHQMIEDEAYVVRRVGSRRRILPVDAHHSGIIQHNTMWPDGQQQFLQLRHAVKLKPEGLVTCFISNVAYFALYNKESIYGVTGTLGSAASQDFIANLYPGTDMVFVPTYMVKRFRELPTIISDTKDEWYNAIERSLAEETSSGAVLAICQSIREVRDIKSLLIQRRWKEAQIWTYAEGLESECDAIKEHIPRGIIILATNLAGRGTDLKLANGIPLHVCVTFLPQNLRVEEQAFGRTARQGQFGTAQMILNREHVEKLFGMRIDAGICTLKALRDVHESKELAEFRTKHLPVVRILDRLFKDFYAYFDERRRVCSNPNYLFQLEDDWGFRLRQIEDDLQRVARLRQVNWTVEEKFAIERLAELQRGGNKVCSCTSTGVPSSSHLEVYKNASYISRCGLDALAKKDYRRAIKLFTKADHKDHNFAYCALFNRSRAHIESRKWEFWSASRTWAKDALLDLDTSLHLIDAMVLPPLNGIKHRVPGGSELCDQFSRKTEIVQLMRDCILEEISHLRMVLNLSYEIRGVTLQRLAEKFEGREVPEEEIAEFHRFGLRNYFMLDVYQSNLYFTQAFPQ